MTKRQLGWLMIASGVLGSLTVFVLGRMGAGAWQGIGPVESVLIASGLMLALSGTPLLKMGQRPAAGSHHGKHRSLPEHAPDTRGSGILIALQIVTLAVYFLYLGVFITYAADLFQWPYDYDQGESFELYDAVLHSQGQWPYRDISTFPFYASNYPPVFHLLNMMLFPVLGKTLLSGRVLSFTITLLTAVLIGYTVRREAGGRFIPIVSGLAYLASNFVYHIGPLCRQQLTMVFFETLAVSLIATLDDHPIGRTRRGQLRLGLGLGALFLAGYTKQLAVFTAVAIFAYLFLRNPLRSLLLVALFGAAFGAVFLALNWATQGCWWVNTISANVNAFIMPQLLGLTRSWLHIHLVFVLVAGATVIYELYLRELSVFSVWFVAALGTGMLSGKWGAGEAYWITSVAAAIILSGISLQRTQAWLTKRLPKRRLIWGALVCMLMLGQAALMVHLPTAGPLWGRVARLLGVANRSVYADYPYYDAMGYTQLGHLMLPRDYESGNRIMTYVRATQKPILSEEAAFAMLADKPVVTNPTQLLNLYHNGMLDTSQLEHMIREEAFGLIIMRAQFYPPPVLAAIGEHYGLVEHIPMNGFTYIIMKPLGSQPQASVER